VPSTAPDVGEWSRDGAWLTRWTERFSTPGEQDHPLRGPEHRVSLPVAPDRDLARAAILIGDWGTGRVLRIAESG